jgi:hypothetical protein
MQAGLIHLECQTKSAEALLGLKQYVRVSPTPHGPPSIRGERSKSVAYEAFREVGCPVAIYHHLQH